MPVVVEAAFEIQMDGSPTWRVATDRLKRIDDQWFIKVRPWDRSFVALVTHDLFKLPPTKTGRLSLAGATGSKALLKLRNDAVCDQDKTTDTQDAAAEALFEAPDENGKRSKKPRMNAARLQELREAPEIFEFTIPGADGRPALAISAVRPAHPCDELCIKLDADTVEQMVHYIRSEGVEVDDLISRRNYGAEEKGVWRNGSAGLVRKLQQESDDDCDMPFVKKKYKSLNKDTDCLPDDPANTAVPLEDLPTAGA